MVSLVIPTSLAAGVALEQAATARLISAAKTQRKLADLTGLDSFLDVFMCSRPGLVWPAPVLHPARQSAACVARPAGGSRCRARRPARRGPFPERPAGAPPGRRRARHSPDP